MHDPTFLAYVAGFFDGEGSIMIGKQHRNYGRGVYFGVVTHVGGTDQASIELLHATWPGHFSMREYNDPRRNPLWRWHLYRQKACAFITDIRPYLRLKANQADLALELGSMMSNLKTSDEDYARMVEINHEVGLLNKRGA